MVPTWFGTLPTSFGENTVTRIPTSTGKGAAKRGAPARLENRFLARKRLLVFDGGHVASSLLKSASNAATIHATILRKWHHTTPTRNK
jgi:hypothetical protein